MDLNENLAFQASLSIALSQGLAQISADYIAKVEMKVAPFQTAKAKVFTGCPKKIDILT